MFVVGLTLGLSGLIAHVITNILPVLIDREIRISGIIVDENTGEGIAYADVQIVGGPSKETDGTGNFEFVVPVSRYRGGVTLMVFDPEYKSETLEISEDLERPVAIKLKSLQKKSLFIGKIKKFQISHWLGHPTVAIDVVLTNSNPSSMKVEELIVYLEDPRGAKISLVPIYLFSVNPPQALRGSYIRINSNSDVSISAEFGYQTPQLLAINNKILQNSPAIAPSPPIERPIFQKALVDEMKKFARDKFLWEEGDWKLNLEIKTEVENVVKEFQFSITESDVIELKKVIDIYDFGYGVLTQMRFAGPEPGFVEIANIH